MKRSLLAALVAVTFVGVPAAHAQTSVNGDATITIGTVLYIDVTNTSVTFPSPGATDFNNGSVAANSGSSSLTHRGNVQHSVRVSSATANLQDSGGASSKPAADLQWTTDGATWAGLSTTATDIVTNAAAGAYNNAETIDYRMLLDFSTDAPETYTLDFTYTVVAS